MEREEAGIWPTWLPLMSLLATGSLHMVQAEAHIVMAGIARRHCSPAQFENQAALSLPLLNGITVGNNPTPFPVVDFF